MMAAPWNVRRTNLVLGIVMTVAGGFLLASVNNDLEIVVLVGGPVLMLAGLATILVMFTKEFPASATWLGAAFVGLGAILFVHDLVLPPAIASVAHVGSGVGVLLLGLAELFGLADLAKRFRKRSAAPPQ